MKKKSLVISLLCSCILQVGWYGNVRAETTDEIKEDGWYDNAKSSASGWYDKAKSGATEAYDDAKNEAHNLSTISKAKYESYKEDKAKDKKIKFESCIDSMKVNLPLYGLFLEQSFMDVNKRNEDKILKGYEKLKNNGISSELQNIISPTILEKLSNSTSSLQYTNISLSALKNIQKELKNNNPDNVYSLIKQTQFFMFSWTTPSEILSTKNIYDNSLLGLNEKLYKNLSKNNYLNYTEFVYSLLFVNLANENVFIKKKPRLDDVSNETFSPYTLGVKSLITDEDKKGLALFCKEYTESYFETDINNYILGNISSTLGIDEQQITSGIEEISKNNNLFTSPVFLNKYISKFDDINIIDNPLNDSWYFMLREYMELQDDFYKIKKEVAKIIKILEILPDSAKHIATLKQNIFEVDALYRKFDEAVRYNIIDLPISIYADLYYIEFRKAKKWYNDDEKALANLAVAYSKSCANMQKYMASEYAINKVIRVTKTIKSEFNEDEWKEVKTRAKLTQDWFNMLNKVKISNL